MTAMRKIADVVGLAGRRAARGVADSIAPENLPSGTYVFLPASVVLDDRLGRSALRVIMLMAAVANRFTRECWLSTDTMAERLGLPRSSIIKGLAQLVEGGHVRRRRRTEPGRGQTSSAYVLLFRPPDASVWGPEKRSEADQCYTTETDEIVTSGLPCQSASLDRITRSPACPEGAPICGEVPPGDRLERSPAPLPGDRISRAGDRNPQGPVTAPRGHDQDTYRILRSGSGARAGETTTASVDNPRAAVPASGSTEHRAKWAARLEQYRPWEGKNTWQPSYGLRPDSEGVNPTMPKDMRAKWRADAAAARARKA